MYDVYKHKEPLQLGFDYSHADPHSHLKSTGIKHDGRSTKVWH